MKRKLIAVLTALILVLTSIVFVGCNKADTMSFNDYQAVELAAAQSFKNEHTEYETFSDVTYHWTKSTTAKENVTLHYNKVAEGDDYTDGVFENKTVENREYSLAIKKADGSLKAKLSVNATTVETDNYVDGNDDYQHKQIETTTVTQETFYITTATKDSETLNVVAHYKSTKVDDDDPFITKRYEEVSDLDELTRLIKDYALSYANASVVRNFFNYTELLLYPGYSTSLTKTGNKVKYSFGYEYMGIESDLSWEKEELTGTALYENNKLLKVEMLDKETAENASMVFDYSLTLSNSAEIEALDLDDYSETERIIELYKNSSQSIIN